MAATRARKTTPKKKTVAKRKTRAKTKPAVASGVTTKRIDHLEKYYIQRDAYSLMPLLLISASPILMHAWGQKAMMQMIGKMTGHDIPQENKDITAEYGEAFYRNVKGTAVIPCRILKRCFLDGALPTKKAVTKTDLGRFLRVMGQTAPIIGTEHMDIRLVSVGGRNKKPDVRARPMYDEWSLKCVLRFPHERLPIDKVLMAVEAAGDAVGLCDWRPSAGSPGEMGCFSIQHVDASEVDSILKECRHAEKHPVIPEAFLRAASKVLDTGGKVPKGAGNAINAAIGRSKKAA